MVHNIIYAQVNDIMNSCSRCKLPSLNKPYSVCSVQMLSLAKLVTVLKSQLSYPSDGITHFQLKLLLASISEFIVGGIV